MFRKFNNVIVAVLLLLVLHGFFVLVIAGAVAIAYRSKLLRLPGANPNVMNAKKVNKASIF